MTQVQSSRPKLFGSALSAALCLSLLSFPAAQAQDAGGVTLRFGLSETLTASNNQSFAPVSSGTTLRSVTDLSFALTTQTRSSSLSLSSNLAFTATDRPNTGITTSISDPRLRLRYETSSAASALSVYANYTRGEVEFIDPLTNFRNELGEIVFTPDFVDLTGTGERQSLTYGASLSLRNNRPFGIVLRADVVDLSFTDTTTPALIDSTRVTLGADARFDISPVLRATLGLTHQQFDTETGSSSETTTLSTDVSLARPNGNIGLRFAATETGGGTRMNLQFSRNFALPGDAQFAASFGVTRPASGNDLFTTGTLSYSQPLPTGSISARLNRSFGLSETGSDEVQTSLSLNASHALTPLATLGLSAAYAQVDDLDLDETSSVSSLSATISYALTPDWSLVAGYNYQVRDTDTISSRDSSSLSLSLSRDFLYRP